MFTLKSGDKLIGEFKDGIILSGTIKKMKRNATYTGEIKNNIPNR